MDFIVMYRSTSRLPCVLGMFKRIAHHCRFCEQSFFSVSSLYEHQKWHEGLTDCPLCGRRLSRISDVRRHLHLQHQVPREQVHALLSQRR